MSEGGGGLRQGWWWPALTATTSAGLAWAGGGIVVLVSPMAGRLHWACLTLSTSHLPTAPYERCTGLVQEGGPR